MEAVAVKRKVAVLLVPPETSRGSLAHCTGCGAMPPETLIVGFASKTAPACPAVPEVKRHVPAAMVAPNCAGGCGVTPKAGMSIEAVAVSLPAVAVTAIVVAVLG